MVSRESGTTLTHPSKGQGRIYRRTHLDVFSSPTTSSLILLLIFQSRSVLSFFSLICRASPPHLFHQILSTFYLTNQPPLFYLFCLFAFQSMCVCACSLCILKMVRGEREDAVIRTDDVVQAAENSSSPPPILSVGEVCMCLRAFIRGFILHSQVETLSLLCTQKLLLCILSFSHWLGNSRQQVFRKGWWVKNEKATVEWMKSACVCCTSSLFKKGFDDDNANVRKGFRFGKEILLGKHHHSTGKN